MKPDEAREGRASTLAARARKALRRGQSTDPFARFTARARTVMQVAQEEGRRRGDDYLGTEHLLLGLLREGDGIAARVLRTLGVELAATREAVDRIVGRSPAAPDDARCVGMAPRLKRVLELANEEAQHLGHRFVGTEHLLLGLVREGEGVGAGILVRQGVTLERVRAEVLALLAGVGQPVEEDAEQGPSTVVMCRLDARTLGAVDALIEAGVRTTRSDAVAWLVQAGIEANSPLLASVQETVTEIRRLRARANALAQEALQRQDDKEGGERLHRDR